MAKTIYKCAKLRLRLNSLISNTTAKKPGNCFLCGKIGEITPATTWCEFFCGRCTKMHRVHPGSQDHELGYLSGEVKVKRKHKVMCQEHKYETVKFHCKDCKKSACQTCCVIHHRACKHVVTIESMKSEIMNTLSEKSKLMYKKMEIKSARLPNLKTKIEEVNQLEDQVLRQIRSDTEKAIAKIKLKEKQFIDELKVVTNKDSLQLKAELKTEEIDIQTYKQHHEFINQALQSQSAMDLYHAYMACESGVGEVGDGWSHNSRDRRCVESIKFVLNTDVVDQTLDCLKLGVIDVKYQDDRSLVPSPVLCDTVNVKLDSDEEEPFPANIIVLVGDGLQMIVVTDFANNSLKSFVRGCNKLHHSKLLMDDGPYGITQVNKKTVMVPVPNASQIAKVQVLPDLTLLSITNTDMHYLSLSFLVSSSSLLAGSTDPQRVDILSLDGHLLKSVSQTINEETFSTSSFLCLTPSGIMISDSYSDECIVTCITIEGNILWKYTPY